MTTISHGQHSKGWIQTHQRCFTVKMGNYSNLCTEIKLKINKLSLKPIQEVVDDGASGYTMKPSAVVLHQ